jgi:nitrous oxidase accessory protein NosD
MSLTGTTRLMTAWTLAIVLGGPAWAGDVCVDPSDASCFSTIGAAIDHPTTVDGDRVIIAEGTYSENVVVDKSLNLIGEDRNDVVILPLNNMRPVISVTAPGVTLQRLTVRGPRAYAAISIEWTGVEATLHAVTVVDATFRECILTRADDTTIRYGKIEACGRSCVSSVGGDDLTVENTRMAACNMHGVEVRANGATIDDSRIARARMSCVFVVGAGASVNETYVKTCGWRGIEIYGDDAQVDRSYTKATEEEGIYGVGNAGVITNNRTRGSLARGIYWRGEATIEQNEVDDAGFDGMTVMGGNFVVQRNEVEDSGRDPFRDCYAIGANDSTFAGNEAEECPNGFDISGMRNTLVENEAEDNVGNGFEVTGRDNRLERNEGMENGRFDLCDEGMAVLVDNDFETQAFAACSDF